jgi:hypothetical protein
MLMTPRDFNIRTELRLLDLFIKVKPFQYQIFSIIYSYFQNHQMPTRQKRALEEADPKEAAAPSSKANKKQKQKENEMPAEDVSHASEVGVANSTNAESSSHDHAGAVSVHMFHILFYFLIAT